LFRSTVFLTDVVSVIPRERSAVVHARLAYLTLPPAADKRGASFFQSADHALALARYTGKAHCLLRAHEKKKMYDISEGQATTTPGV